MTRRWRPDHVRCPPPCNESFASTNEREGSEIARQIIRALTEAGIRIIFVTHLYDLARSLYKYEMDHGSGRIRPAPDYQDLLETARIGMMCGASARRR
jgi:hypothetical protein